MEKKIKVQPEIIEQPIDVSEEPFVSVETQDKTVELDMTNGDQQILPDDGYALSSVTVDKPDTLAPENIKSGVNIGGVEGTYDPVLRVQLLFYDPFDGDVMITCTRTPAEIIEAVNNGITVVAYTAGHFLSDYWPLGQATFTQVSVSNNTVAFEGVVGLRVNMWNEYPEAYVRIYKNVNSDGNLWSQTVDLMNGPATISVAYEHLVELRNSNQLIPGQQYRIDYQTIINGTYDLSEVGGEGYVHYARDLGQEDLNGFDVVVTADDESHLNENARAVRNSWTSETSTPEAWELKYCLDNDTDRFAWASEDGTGVIYYMKDEYGNEAGYDFKNIQFLRYALKCADATPDYTPVSDNFIYNATTNPNRYGTPYYVFLALQSYMETGEYESPFPIYYKGNKAHNHDFGVGEEILNTIQWDRVDGEYLETFNADWYYTFDYYDGEKHYDISSAEINGVTARCRNNKIASGIDLFARQLDSDTIIYGLPSNVFMIHNKMPNSTPGICKNNEIGLSGAYNTFSDRCSSNILGEDSSGNMFGYNCHDNNCGYSSDNTVCQGCSDNTFISCGDSYLNCSNVYCNELIYGVYFSHVKRLFVSHYVQQITIIWESLAEYPPQELLSYDGIDTHATHIIKRGYGNEEARTTTDGGATWA